MDVIRGAHNLHPAHRDCAVTIGNFDGVHRGHKTLLAQLSTISVKQRVPSLLITFEPQPREFLAGSSMPARLTRFREKAMLLRQAGIDKLLCLPFNERVANLTAEFVVEEFLVKRLAIRYMLIGDDFRFGKDRCGDYQMLKQAGQRNSFGVEHLDTQTLGDERISSTAIRRALQAGDMALAEQRLSHVYFIMGRVTDGRSRGTRIMIPTANIHLHRYRTALSGTFVVLVDGLLDRPLPAVANVGIRPTINGTEPLLEVHVLDYRHSFYGRLIKVRFLHWIRAEQKFASLAELRERITEDIAHARRWFACSNRKILDHD